MNSRLSQDDRDEKRAQHTSRMPPVSAGTGDGCSSPSSHPRLCFHRVPAKGFPKPPFSRISFPSNFVSEAFEGKFRRDKQQQQ